MSPAGLRVSVAVPLHNEERAVPELLQRINRALDQIPGGPHEIVLVDDGSSDRTLELLEAAAETDPRLVVIALSRNFGHQAAISAALDHAGGDAVVVMDGDLQDVPEAIPQFVEQFQRGFDVVYAQRVRRKEGLLLRASYFIFYRLLARLSDVALPVDAGDFGLMSRRVVDHLRNMPEHHRYLRGLRSWVGFRQIGVPVERSPRHSGQSKYTFRRLLKLAGDGVLAFSIVPLRAAAIAGLMVIALAVLFSIYSVIVKFFFHVNPPRGFTALVLIITFLSGFNLFFLGIIGEYVGRIYEEIKSRPLYIVGRLIQAGRAERARSAGSAASSRFPGARTE
jgi:glycosyltransferase involved in cell wall biosynthesis